MRMAVAAGACTARFSFKSMLNFACLRYIILVHICSAHMLTWMCVHTAFLAPLAHKATAHMVSPHALQLLPQRYLAACEGRPTCTSPTFHYTDYNKNNFPSGCAAATAEQARDNLDVIRTLNLPRWGMVKLADNQKSVARATTTLLGQAVATAGSLRAARLNLPRLCVAGCAHPMSMMNTHVASSAWLRWLLCVV
jgi:hypothetical protein